MKKIFLIILFKILFLNSSYACIILNVPIGSDVIQAAEKFDFLTKYNPEVYGQEYSVKYKNHAVDFCENAGFDVTELEVTVYDSKIAAIRLTSSKKESNEVYNFAKNFVSDPGNEAQDKNWLGSVNLSIGSLFIIYGTYKERGLITEALLISNDQMMDYISGEDVIEADW